MGSVRSSQAPPSPTVEKDQCSGLNREQDERGWQCPREGPAGAVVGEGGPSPRPCMMGGSPASPGSLVASQAQRAYSSGECRVHTAMWQR